MALFWNNHLVLRPMKIKKIKFYKNMIYIWNPYDKLSIKDNIKYMSNIAMIKCLMRIFVKLDQN